MLGSEPEGQERRIGELVPGTHIGRYRLDEIVGRGGMGTVYRAFDEETKRDVAVKVLLPDLPEGLRERFLAECEAEAKIRHPHVMPVYDRGTYKGDRLYFVMELVYEPITLGELVETAQKGKLASRWPRLRHWGSSKRLVQDVLIPIAEGVDAANREYGYLHRDLKPDNILIDVRTRRPYLIDFGICYLEGQPVEKDKIVGTPRFLSPEQSVTKVTPRTDVWGLGALLYYVLTGHPPIQASSPLRRQERDQRIHDLLKSEARARSEGKTERANELAARRKTLEDPSFRTLDDMIEDARHGRYQAIPESVPAAARAIVQKAMAPAPGDRYESAGELAEDLKAWVSDGKVRALAEQDATTAAVAAASRTLKRHVGPILLALLGLALGGALGHKFLSGASVSTRERIQDTLEMADRLVADVDALAGTSLTPAEGAIAYDDLRGRLAALAAAVELLPAGAERTKIEQTVASLRARTAPPRLVLAAAEGRAWHAESTLGGPPLDLDVGVNTLPPGSYRVRAATRADQASARGVDIPVLLPLEIPTRAETPTFTPPQVELTLTLPDDGIPHGMVYVPAGAPAKGEEPIPGFLIQAAEVTYLDYAEWLDELDDAEREKRLPEAGFVPDPNHRGRYLVKSEYEDRPIQGVSPGDAAAYTAWRSELYGKPYALPTEAQWRRAAGAALLGPSYAAFFRRAGVPEGGRRALPDRSPFGAEAMLTAPAEIARSENGYVLKGRGHPLGIAPTTDALARADVIEPDARTPAAFRLVLLLP